VVSATGAHAFSSGAQPTSLMQLHPAARRVIVVIVNVMNVNLRFIVFCLLIVSDL
jgi:hypothetical protein